MAWRGKPRKTRGKCNRAARRFAHSRTLVSVSQYSIMRRDAAQGLHNTLHTNRESQPPPGAHARTYVHSPTAKGEKLVLRTSRSAEPPPWIVHRIGCTLRAGGAPCLVAVGRHRRILQIWYRGRGTRQGGKGGTQHATGKRVIGTVGTAVLPKYT